MVLIVVVITDCAIYSKGRVQKPLSEPWIKVLVTGLLWEAERRGQLSWVTCLEDPGLREELRLKFGRIAVYFLISGTCN